MLALIVPATQLVLQRTPVLHALPATIQLELAEDLHRKAASRYSMEHYDRAYFYSALCYAARHSVLFSVISLEPLTALLEEITETAFTLHLHE